MVYSCLLYTSYSNLVAESRFDTLDSPRDRAFASTLFYGVLERQITLRRIVASYCRKPVDKFDPEVLCALEMGLYQPVSYTHLDVYKRQAQGTGTVPDRPGQGGGFGHCGGAEGLCFPGHPQ